MAVAYVFQAEILCCQVHFVVENVCFTRLYVYSRMEEAAVKFLTE
jgi:hypothetical protein